MPWLECRDVLWRSQNGESPGDSVDVDELFQRLREEVRRSGSDPGGAAPREGDREAARAEAERLWPVSADRSLRLRPGCAVVSERR